eukprot:2038559-Amphidinium_carterae.1
MKLLPMCEFLHQTHLVEAFLFDSRFEAHVGQHLNFRSCEETSFELYGRSSPDSRPCALTIGRALGSL